jgi:hypothetical protein
MNDLPKEHQVGTEAVGPPQDAVPVDAAGWFGPETAAAEIDPWVAFMRGGDPSPRRPAAHAKKPWVFGGLRKRGSSRQFSNP